MSKRFFDIIFSIFGIFVFFPLLLIIASLIKIDSRGPILFIQKRVGRFGKDFSIYKFRTMYVNTEKLGQLTVGSKDSRITKIGKILRQYKLDELPQLLNVLKGDMSFVGPRPEVRKYVNLYTSYQSEILYLKPGITDLASLRFINENEILGKQGDPEKYYIEHIMIHKLRLNRVYLKKMNFILDLYIICLTCIKSIKP